MYGKPFHRNVHDMRRMIGFCPQFNALNGLLTVYEHLYLCAEIKGVTHEECDAATTAWLEQVGLETQSDTLCAALDGCMERRLAVAMAFIGGSKLVLLDEPTKSMDPLSRRLMYEVINRNKAGRMVLLTTEFLDEAYLFSDQVIIMQKGEVEASGTPNFIRDRFRVGYHLTLTKLDDCTVEREAAVNKLVVDTIPNALPMTHTRGHMHFYVPVPSRFDAPSAIKGGTREHDDDDDGGDGGGGTHDDDDVKEMKSKKDSRRKRYTGKSTAPADDDDEPSRKDDDVVTRNLTLRYGKDDTFSSSLHMAALFRKLDDLDTRRHYAIKRYHLNAITLDEMFLRIATADDIDRDAARVSGQLIRMRHRPSARSTSAGPVGASRSSLTVGRSTTASSPVAVLDRVDEGAGEQDVAQLKTKQDRNIEDSDGVDSDIEPDTVTADGDDGSEQKKDDDVVVRRSEISFFKQVRVIVWKRYVVARADAYSSSVSTLLLLLFVGACLLLLGVDVSRSGPEITLDGELYADPRICVSSMVGEERRLLSKRHSQFEIFDGEWANNMSSLSISQSLLAAFTQHDGDRVGCFVPEDKLEYRHNVALDVPVSLTVMHNTTSSHALPVMKAALFQARLRQYRSNDSSTYVVRNHPLPLTDVGILVSRIFLTLFTAFFILIPMTYIPASYATFVHEESVVRARHVQFSSGVYPSAYWLANFVWDYGKFHRRLDTRVCALPRARRRRVYRLGAHSARHVHAVRVVRRRRDCICVLGLVYV